MVKKTYSIYLYDEATAQEYFLAASPEYIRKNGKGGHQAAARELFDDRTEEFFCLSLDGGSSLGTYLVEALSIDFNVLIKGIQAMADIPSLSKANTPNAIHFMFDAEPERKPSDVITDLQNLYCVKCYIDVCTTEPFLYNLSSLERLSESVNRKSCIPQLFGLFSPMDGENGSKCILGTTLPDISPLKTDSPDEMIADIGSLYRTRLRQPLPQNAVRAYNAASVLDRVFASLYTLMERGIAVGKCGMCGKYFIPQGRAIYCDRPCPRDPKYTCKEYGSQRLWYDKMRTDEVAKLARTVYTGKQMSVRRNPDNEKYLALFEYFKAERKKWEAAVKAGKKTADEYKEWLNIIRYHKTMESEPGIMPIPPALTDND